MFYLRVINVRCGFICNLGDETNLYFSRASLCFWIFRDLSVKYLSQTGGKCHRSWDSRNFNIIWESSIGSVPFAGQVGLIDGLCSTSAIAARPCYLLTGLFFELDCIDLSFTTMNSVSLHFLVLNILLAADFQGCLKSTTRLELVKNVSFHWPSFH